VGPFTVHGVALTKNPEPRHWFEPATDKQPGRFMELAEKRMVRSAYSKVYSEFAQAIGAHWDHRNSLAAYALVNEFLDKAPDEAIRKIDAYDPFADE
jgi:hypothetical protein